MTLQTRKSKPLGRGARWALLFLCAAAVAAALAGNARAEVDLWPLYESTDDSTTVLYPFYVHEGDFRMNFPFYYRTNDGKDTHLVWPMVKFSEGRLTRFAPFWFSPQEGTYSLFPIIRQTPQYTLWTVPPVYHRNDGEFSAVFPLYMKSPDDLFVFPDIYLSSGPGDRERVLVWPFVDYKTRPDAKELVVAYAYRREREPGRLVDELWPVFLRRETAKSKILWVLPYYREESPAVSETWVLPLYAKRRIGDSKTLWVGPYYSKRSPNRSETWVLPLFVKRRIGTATTFWAGPYLEEKSDFRSYTALFPLYKSERIEMPARKQTKSTLSILEIYKREQTLSQEGDVIKKYRRFLFFSDDRDDSGVRTFEIFGLPIVERMA